MNCTSNHSLFLRSNGILVCWDDFGSYKELQVFDPEKDYAHDVYLGPVFGHIRQSLAAGDMPFPDFCSNCFCLQSQLPFDDFKHVREKYIETFQIEPSMGCQLECPGCIPKSERQTKVRKTDHGHMTLNTDVLFKIVDDLKRAGVRIGKFDMQGHGEPLLHKKIWEICGYLSTAYPDAVVSICTHSNADFKPEMVHSGVNEMLFAIDGVDQASYSPYRINGQFDRAYAFMRSFSQTAAEQAPHINRVWKYVIFDHNDLPGQLLRAQEMALEAKISTLRFVITQLGNASSRIMDAADIPILDPSLNIFVDNYRIKVEQLDAGLKQLKDAIFQLNLKEAKSWAGYLSNSLHRLFQTAPTISPAYQDVIDRYRSLIGNLPAQHFGGYDTQVATATRRTGPLTQRKFRSNHRPPPPLARNATVEECRRVLETTVVDENWYRRTYPDIGDAIEVGTLKSASEHFGKWGYYEERLPYAPDIDVAFYLRTYPDVAQAIRDHHIRDALTHFVLHGYREGRLSHALEALEGSA